MLLAGSPSWTASACTTLLSRDSQCGLVRALAVLDGKRVHDAPVTWLSMRACACACRPGRQARARRSCHVHLNAGLCARLPSWTAHVRECEPDSDRVPLWQPHVRGTCWGTVVRETSRTASCEAHRQLVASSSLASHITFVFNSHS